MPPAIDSLDLPPFRPRFPWWGADLQTLAVLLHSPVSDLSPHASERVCFPMADRTGDILLGMLDRPAEPHDRCPLVILIHGLTGCEDSAYILSAARHLLDCGYGVLRLNVRGAGPSRAYCGEHYHAGQTADFRPQVDDQIAQIPHVRRKPAALPAQLLDHLTPRRGHSSRTTQREQCGLRDSHVRRPCQINN